MIKISLRITNSTSKILTLRLEPWGDQHTMVAGATITVEAQGPSGDTLEVEYGEDDITLYGWTGSTVSLTDSEKK